MRKRLMIGLAIFVACSGIGLTILTGIWISHIETRKAEAAYPKCSGKHTVHTAVFKDNKVVPEHTDAKRCDTLTITNTDDQERILAFGEHDHHTAYDGVTERYLSKNGSLTVTLVQPGNFKFHDHEDDSMRGTFTVKN